MAGFSSRLGGCTTTFGKSGELNLGFGEFDAAENVLTNRQLLAEAVSGSPQTGLATLKQIHSDHIHLAELPDNAIDHRPDGDGLITAKRGLLVGIQTADCVPVLIADPVKRAVGAFHAGWRGTAAAIVEKGVAKMAAEFGSKAEDMIAAIGVGIGRCCYTVGPELYSEFCMSFEYGEELFSHDDAGGLHLDLIEANRRQLLAAGIAADAIVSIGGCTLCNQDLFFSYRGEKGRTGRLLAVIGVKK